MGVGNDGVDACTYDLNLASEAIRVNGMNKQLELNSQFDYGRCVDILAPGAKLEYEDQYLSGTSYSAPIVSGLAAYLYSLSPMKDSQYLARHGDMKLLIKLYAMTAKLVPGEPDRGTPLLLANNGLDFG